MQLWGLSDVTAGALPLPPTHARIVTGASGTTLGVRADRVLYHTSRAVPLSLFIYWGCMRSHFEKVPFALKKNLKPFISSRALATYGPPPVSIPCTN